jgi:hypothetical protein
MSWQQQKTTTTLNSARAVNRMASRLLDNLSLESFLDWIFVQPGQRSLPKTIQGAQIGFTNGGALPFPPVVVASESLNDVID